jgi:hypothetical protein
MRDESMKTELIGVIIHSLFGSVMNPPFKKVTSERSSA